MEELGRIGGPFGIDCAVEERLHIEALLQAILQHSSMFLIDGQRRLLVRRRGLTEVLRIYGVDQHRPGIARHDENLLLTDRLALERLDHLFPSAPQLSQPSTQTRLFIRPNASESNAKHSCPPATQRPNSTSAKFASANLVTPAGVPCWAALMESSGV